MPLFARNRKRSVVYNSLLNHLVLYFVILLSLSSAAYSQQSKASHGLINLSNCNFKNGDIPLGGEWEVFVNKLYTPTDFENSSLADSGSLMQIPTNINGKVINGVLSPKTGLITYRLKVVLPKEQVSSANFLKELGLYVVEIHSAYNLWINGVCILQQGIVSSDSTIFKAEMHPRRVFFSSNKDTVEIVINAANYFDSKMFGMDDYIYIGTEDNILSQVNKKIFFYIFSFGVLLLTSLYHLFLSVHKHDRKINFSFGLLTFLLAAQSLVGGERVILMVFPNISTELIYKIFMFTLNLIPMFMLFLYRLYPLDTSKLFLKISATVFFAFTMLVSFTQYITYSIYLDYILIFGFVILFYIYFVCIIAYKNKRPYSALTLLGMTVPVLVGVNDLLFGLDIIITGYYTPIAFLFFVTFQSYILSVKLSKMHAEVNLLTKELTTLNEGLEKTVELRTQQIKSANQKLQKVNDAKDKFISILSHDLKNPFHIFLGYTEIIMDAHNDLPKEQLLSFAKSMHETASSGYKLLENLLDWSRFQLGVYIPEPIKIRLSALIETEYKYLANSAKLKEIEISISSDNDYYIFADEKMIATSFRNILSNAIKFTHRGGKINIICANKNPFVEIKVIDSGTGMNDALLEMLFKINVKVTHAGTENETGTGLGLVLVKEFVEKNNGSVEIVSKLGEGTTIILYIPAAPGE